jgi:hypothetical protein
VRRLVNNMQSHGRDHQHPGRYVFIVENTHYRIISLPHTRYRYSPFSGDRAVIQLHSGVTISQHVCYQNQNTVKWSYMSIFPY